MERTVLLVDDHDAFRRAARSLLELDGFAVVGEAGDGASALLLADRLAPQLVLLDVVLPDMDGFDVAERLTAGGCQSVVVLTSSRDLHDAFARIRRSGARGFIPKDRLCGEAILRLVEAAS